MLINHEKVIEIIRQKINPIQGIYLFGSYATGDANIHSDVDIAILAEKPIEQTVLDILVELLAEALKINQVDLLDLRCVNVILQEEIIKIGQRIFTENKQVCELYEDYIYMSAMDFKTFRAPLVKEILARGSIYG